MRRRQERPHSTLIQPSFNPQVERDEEEARAQEERDRIATLETEARAQAELEELREVAQREAALAIKEAELQAR